MVATERRKLQPGVYGPLPTFFDETQEIDFVSYKKHLLSELTSLHLFDLVANTCIPKTSLQKELVSRAAPPPPQPPPQAVQKLLTFV